MNKKEAASFDKAILEARIARALRWSDEVSIAPDVAPPEFGAHTEGWLFNSYAARVEPAWSDSTRHGTGQRRDSGSQGSRPLYSTRLLALRAMRCETERKYAELLASIDAQINAEAKS